MIISYAQNFEDVMLWRALGNIENGFYIDVGANDPKYDSVTKLFYDQGWSGINIEPVSQWFDKLAEDRKRDINLKVAAGSGSGEITLYDLPDTGLCTLDKTTAERHEREQGYTIAPFTAELRTLAEICETYCHSDIHFLKIDVEGAELDVIQGMDFDRFRPWIVLVESTIPNQPTENCASWEPLLLQNGYKVAYFDGLNRFYISSERYRELSGFFEVPPNVFDKFDVARVLDAQNEANERVALADAKAAEETRKVMELAARLEKVNAELHAERQSRHHFSLLSESRAIEIEDLRDSLSWRITAPLRWLARPLMGESDLPGMERTYPHERLIRWAMSRPMLVNFVHALVDSVPPLRKAITALVAGSVDNPTGHSRRPVNLETSVDNQLASLTPAALQIYEDLRDAVIERESGKDRCVS